MVMPPRLEQKIELKNRIIAVLLTDARLVSGHSAEDCAVLLGIKPEEYAAFEQGTSAPTLPQLEVLSYYFNVPINHFWGTTTIAKKREDDELQKRVPEMLMIRQRIIAVRIRQLRDQARYSLEDVSERTGLTISKLENVERGVVSLELNELELVANALNAGLSDLIDDHGSVGNWIRSQDEFEVFKQLPADLREFVLKPVNRPYLDLALKMSEMNVDRLRGIAESILDITY